MTARTYDIPMDKESYDVLRKALTNNIFFSEYKYRLDYDDDFQQAHIRCRDNDLIEQTNDSYIISGKDAVFWMHPCLHFIDKKTGEIRKEYPHTHIHYCYHLVERIMRVYGDDEKDFLYDETKRHIRDRIEAEANGYLWVPDDI